LLNAKKLMIKEKNKTSITLPVVIIIFLALWLLTLSQYYGDLKYAKENGEKLELTALSCTPLDEEGEDYSVVFGYEYEDEFFELDVIDTVSYDEGETVEAYIMIEPGYRDMDDFVVTEDGKYIFIDQDFKYVFILGFVIFVLVGLSRFSVSSKLCRYTYIFAVGIALYGIYFGIREFVISSVVIAAVAFASNKGISKLFSTSFSKGAYDNTEKNRYESRRKEIHDDNCYMDGTGKEYSFAENSVNAEKNMALNTRKCFIMTLLYFAIFAVVLFVIHTLKTEDVFLNSGEARLVTCGAVFLALSSLYGFGLGKLYYKARRDYDAYRGIMHGYMEYSREMAPLKKHTALFYSLLVFNFILFLAEIFICVIQIIK